MLRRRARRAGQPLQAHIRDQIVAFAEIGNLLRRHVLRGALDPDAAYDLLSAGWPLIDHRHDMRGRLAYAARGRHRHLTLYDALYAALAGALETPLVTCDERLAGAPSLGCRVVLVRP